MSEEKINNQYEQLKSNTSSASSKAAITTSPSVVTKNIFSMKNFVITKQTSPQTSNKVIFNLLEMHTPVLTTDAENMETDRAIDEPKSPDICLLIPTTTNDFQAIDDSVVVSQHMSDQSQSDTSSDTTNSESDDTEDSNCNINNADDDIIVQHKHTDISRPPIVTKSIAGVRFINSQELSFVDKQRAQHSNIKWYPEQHSKEQQHKTIHKPNCSEFASDQAKIERSGGAFIARPYWKLEHTGIREHEQSDLYRQSKERRIIGRTIRNKGNVVDQMRCVNMQKQTEKYLSILIQAIWYILTEEIALMKFKSLIQFLQRVECPGIVEWMKLSNVKQRYWGHEAISEWLLSINSYIQQQQMQSIRKSNYINIIVDETQDISIQKMVSICLRYVEQDTGTIEEELFKIKPIFDTTGEGFFHIIQSFVDQLEKDAHKQFIITGQTYDGVSSMSKKGHTIPKPSNTRWTYNYETVRFGVKHYLSIVQTLTTISQLKIDGASDDKRYAIDLLQNRTAFKIILLKNILQPAMKFLRQIETRVSCMDNFTMHVDAAVAAISQTVKEFDFISLRTLMNNVQQYMPTILSTTHSTRSRAPAQAVLIQQTFDENELRESGEQIVASVLQSLNAKFDREAIELIKNFSILSTPSKMTADELLNNESIQKYTKEITYTHISVDNKVYTRTDPPLLNIYKLKTDVHSFLTFTKDKTTITSILTHLAKYG
ncbi:unnamed protein product [Rotaria sordida]|uniref:DUF4371 domain-containing protein n=1 Tax=Rotaria sordida TaxID=392033 RepID=A0A815ZQ25_9BILA|nr:unnamed protein product [Rotaria sordida]CAF1586043.1 unnamed protein product [Rotaria sordida]